jgi:hypothetical protein
MIAQEIFGTQQYGVCVSIKKKAKMATDHTTHSHGEGEGGEGGDGWRGGEEGGR